jgi:hypothetical protein
MIAQATERETLPRAIAAEAQVIGSLLIAPECIREATRLVRPSDFLSPLHRAAMVTIVNMHRDGAPIDVVTVNQQLAKRIEFQNESSAAYLAETGQAVVSASNILYHAKLVAEASRKRQLHLVARDVAADALNGKSSADILSDLGAFVDDFRRSVDPSAAELEAHTLPEFMRLEFHQNFLINGTITEAQPGVVSAKSKTNKTNISAAMAVSIASGRPFLNHYEVPAPQPCGIISGESGGATIQEGFGRISSAMGLLPCDLKDLIVSTKVPLLTAPEGREQIERLIVKYGLKALFVDPTYKAFAGVDDSQLSQMALHLFPISEIIDRTGCSIIMVHHNKKTPRAGDHYAEPTQDDIQGTGFQQWARFFVLLNKRREWDPNSGQHWLWFKTEGSAGFGSRYFLNLTEGRRSDHGGRVWDVALTEPHEGAEQERDDAAAIKEAAQMEKDRSAVCGVLVRHPEGVSWSKALRAAKVSSRRWDAVKETMLDEGDVVECDITVSNQKTPIPGVKLSATEAA